MIVHVVLRVWILVVLFGCSMTRVQAQLTFEGPDSTGYTVRLGWSPSPSPEVTGYSVYYGYYSGQYSGRLEAGNVTDVRIAGLAANVVYYFMVAARDDYGLESTPSNEVSYSVPLGSDATDTVIVDNTNGTAQVEVVGSWSLSAATGAWGPNYLHDRNELKGSKSVRFIPNLPSAGEWEVALWYVAGANRPANVPVETAHAGGLSTVVVDQQKNGSQWFVIGTNSFMAGTGGSVKIGTGGTSGYVMADAVRFRQLPLPVVTVAAADASAGEPGSGQGSGTFTFTRTGSTALALTVSYSVSGTAGSGSDYTSIGTSVKFAAGSATATQVVSVVDDSAVENPETVVVRLASGSGYTIGTPASATVTISDDDQVDVAEVIVDNANGTAQVEVVGSWSLSTATGAWGPNYLHDRNELKGSKSVRFIPNLPSAGEWEVALWYVAGANRPANVPVEIAHAGGLSTVVVDQQKNGSQWFVIGTNSFAAGIGGWVKIGTGGTSGYVMADAVRFRQVAVALPVVSMAATDASAGEPGSGQGSGAFTFTRTGSTALALTVSYSVSGTAASGSDYTSIGTSVKFAAGSATATQVVSVVDDSAVENPETVMVRLAPGSGYTIGTPASAAVTISDDDSNCAPLDFVTEMTLTTLQNGFDRWLGMRLKVGPSPLEVSALGRIYIQGNVQNHELRLVEVGSGVTVASVVWTPAGGVANQLKHALLAIPAVLAANTEYDLVSREYSGGDQWYHYSTVVSTTGDAAVLSAVYSTTGTTWTPYSTADHAYGPVSLQYCRTSSYQPLNTVRLGSGTLAGQLVSAARREIKVAPGASLQGTFSIIVSNGMSGSAVAPVAVTPTWGNPETSYWVENSWIGTGVSTETVDVNLTAPMTPGTYYLVVAMAGTYNGAQIMSGTHPGYTANWTEGNIVAELPTSHLELGAAQGWIPFDWWTPAGPVHGELALTSVRVIVEPTVQLASQEVAGGGFVCVLKGNAGVRYVIEASTDLKHWIPLATNTMSAAGSLSYKDRDSGRHGSRFYRLKETIRSANPG